MKVLTNRIRDWRGLRKALGLQQIEMAHLLGYRSASTVCLIEMGDTVPKAVNVEHLRRQLRKPQYRSRLEHSDYDYPFKGDWKQNDNHTGKQ